MKKKEKNKSEKHKPEDNKLLNEIKKNNFKKKESRIYTDGVFFYVCSASKDGEKIEIKSFEIDHLIKL